MAVELTEQIVVEMAPGEGALRDGRGLIQKGCFRGLAKTADGALVFAECVGSGKAPYRVRVDLAGGEDRPRVACDCPSRAQPCKHAIGLMLAFVARGGDVPVAAPPALPAPDEVASSEVRQRPGQRVAQARKQAEQAEALATLERFVVDLVAAGLGALHEGSAKAIEHQASRMGDADLQGVRAHLLRMARAAALDGSGRAERLAGTVTQLWALVREGRRVLARGGEEGTGGDPDDARILTLLGRKWQLTQLREAGFWVRDRVFLELAHERFDDPVTGVVETTGWLLDLDDGAVVMERTIIPQRAAQSADVRHRRSRPGVLAVREAARYPGGGANLRVRWNERDPEACVERPRTAEDYARVHGLARTLDDALTTYRAQLADPLAPREAVLLLAARRVGQVGAELVLEDGAARRIALRDPPGAPAVTVACFRHAAGSYGVGSVAARLFVDRTLRAVVAQPLALFAGERQLRLGM